MKTIIVFLAFFAASLGVAQTHIENGQPNPPEPQAQEGWYQQVSGNTNYLFQVQFTSRDTGYIAGGDDNGNGYFYRTTNSGTTWSLFGPPEAGGFFYFLNSQIGWVSSGSNNKLLYTENAGTTWEERGHGVGKFKFANKDTGWGVSGLTFYISYNAGKDWRSLGPGLGNGQLYDLVVFDTKHMLAVGAQYPSSPDGCASLAYDSAGASRRVPWCLHTGLGSFGKLDSTTVLAMGADTKNNYRPTIYISRDRGFHWEEKAYPNDDGTKIGPVYFSDDHNGTMVGNNGSIARTRDGGISWEKQSFPVIDDLRSVHFTDSLYGAAVGEKGLILHTTDAGKTWVKQSLPADPFTSRTYPDPSQGNANLYFSLPTAQRISLTISDETGKIVSEPFHDAFFSEGKQSIPLNLHLASGVYYYRIQAGTMIGTGRITIIK